MLKRENHTLTKASRSDAPIVIVPPLTLSSAVFELITAFSLDAKKVEIDWLLELPFLMSLLFEEVKNSVCN